MMSEKSDQPQARTRANKLPHKGIIDKAHVGDADMPETCPRCGWACTHLTSAYWESPWNTYGGMCSECCKEAAARFDVTGWPPEPVEDEVEEPATLFGDG